MTKHSQADVFESAVGAKSTAYEELPNRLMTAFDVAAFVGCHEETVRRASARAADSATR